jgi:hypothetical protein
MKTLPCVSSLGSTLVHVVGVHGKGCEFTAF